MRASYRHFRQGGQNTYMSLTATNDSYPVRQPETRARAIFSSRAVQSGGMTRLWISFLELVNSDSEVQGRSRRQRGRHRLSAEISGAFEVLHAPYVQDEKQASFRFIARASGEQAAAVRRALESLNESGSPGGTQRLRDAAVHANAGRHVVAVPRSVCAVESVACKIDPEAKRALASALHSLERNRFLTHSALAEALGKPSAPHRTKGATATRGSSVQVLAESLFMFGICASFSAYLAQKHGQIESRVHQ